MSTAVAIKERPILFSGPMVRAILEGRKTQTRRILNPQIWSEAENTPGGCGYAWHPKGKNSLSFAWNTTEQALADHLAAMYCPYGKPGDRLWVRETLRRDAQDYWRFADGELVTCEVKDQGAMLVWAHHKDRDTCSSIYMPRWASRITLEITDIRVRRLQEISEADAVAEGIRRPEDITAKEADVYEGAEKVYFDALNQPLAVFRRLWDEINGKKAPWESNPWVWVVEFKRIEK